MPPVFGPVALCLALVASQDSPALDDDVAEVLPRLVEMMEEGIDVPEPNASWAKGKQSLFQGSYDWHSCVIAHWALLSHARVTGDEELAGRVLARLKPKGLGEEMKLLKEQADTPRITFPYDEAWFVMLLAEVDRHRPLNDNLIRARMGVERRILKHLEDTPFPEGIAGAEFCGFYRSWLLALFLMEEAGPVVTNGDELLAELAREKLEPARAAIQAEPEGHPWDFLWVPAILALRDRVQDAERESPYTPVEPQLPEGVTIQTVHVLGAFCSRLWPDAIDGSRGNEEAWARFQQGTRHLIEREDLWAEDFATSSHWMPQYLWMGYWWGGLRD